ncbi:MAG: VOC family protein, partial [Nocardioidaceae bacterium]
MQKITPCLWFDTQGEEAANFYSSVFKDSRILDISHYGGGGPRPEGMVMVVEFEIAGQRFTALNGGPEFKFTEAVSLQVDCADQDEVDYYWE